MTIDTPGTSGISAGIAPAPPGSRIAVIDFGPGSLNVALLIVSADGSIRMLDSRSLPPVSATDVTVTGLPAVVSAVVDVLRMAGITAPTDLHALYLSGDAAHDPLVQNAFRPLCVNQRMKQSSQQVAPAAMRSPESEQSSSRLRLALVSGGVLAAVVVVVLAIVGVGGEKSVQPDHPKYPTVAVGDSLYDNFGAVDASTGRLYVGNQQDKTVSVVDTASRQVVATIPLPGQPMGIAVDPELHRLYVVGRGKSDGETANGSLSFIDTATNQVSKTIETGEQSWGVAVDPGTHRVYVVNLNALGYASIDSRTNPNGGSTLSVIDPQSQSVLAQVGIGSNGMNIAIDPATHTAYITAGYFDGSQSRNGLVMVDLAADRVSGNQAIDTDPGGVFDVAVDSGAHVAYLTSNSKIFAFDLVSNTVVATLGGGGHHSIVMDPTSHTAYVMERGGRTVKLLAIDTPQRTAATTIDTGASFLLGFTIDPKSHTIFAFAGHSVVFVPTPR